MASFTAAPCPFMSARIVSIFRIVRVPSVWPGFGAEHGTKNCKSLERRLDDVASSPLIAHAFDVADQVADDIYLVDIAIGDFHVGELVLDHDHQFQPVEPVGPQIISEVRFIRDTLDVDAQMVGNDSADIVVRRALSHSRWCAGSVSSYRWS